MKAPLDSAPSSIRTLTTPGPEGAGVDWQRRLRVGALVVGLGLYLYHGGRAIRENSVTYDETVHLAAGYAAWKEHDFHYLGADHPPLAEMVAALPLYLGVAGGRPGFPTDHPSYAADMRYQFADVFLFRNRVDASRMLSVSRWSGFLVFSLILGASMWALAERLRPGAGTWSLLLTFCEPNLLANATLVTTDFGSAALYLASFWAALAYLERPGPRRALLAGAVCAALITAKYSNVIALPALAVLVYWPRAGRARRHLARDTALALGGFAAGVAAVYLGTDPAILWDGVVRTWQRANVGRSAFLMGHYSLVGWPYFLPVAAALKSTVPHLLLAAAGLAAFVREAIHRRERWLFAFAGLPAFHFLLTCTSRVQIGLRYALPVYPFALVLAGFALAGLSRLRPRAWLASAAIVGLAAASAFRVSPWFLTYFNEPAGGPDRGYRYLVDSNLDWGQGLGALADYVEKRGVHSVYLSYFGVADPHYYGLAYVPLGMLNSGCERPGDPRRSPLDEARTYFAISATNYQGVYYGDHDVFSWLRPLKPEATIAHSIFVYDLSREASAPAALARLLAASGWQQEAQRLAATVPRRRSS